ncbi:MAG: mechanosensitive ion channel family protein [Thermodesulfobacteriota bacterium]|nr:mechanosensitive ion channel family protein [Thermodesulfobacteriota bacterium]
MNKWNELIEKIAAGVGIETTYFALMLKSMMAIAGALIAWFILKGVLSTFEKRIKKHTDLQINGQAFKSVKKVFFYVLFLVTVTYLIRLFNIQVIENVFHAIMVVLLASPANEFFRIAIQYLEKHLADKTETDIDNIVFDLLKKFAGAIIYITAIIIALDMLGVNVMPFIAGAGVAGIAIGFAAKDTLSNLIAGVLLIIDRPFEVGDRIEVWTAPSGSATWGDVIDIGLRATKIKTTDNIVIVIPNNEIMKRDIINYTIITSKIRVRVNIGIAYDADIEKAKGLIREVADSAEWILKNPAPKVVVRNFGESSVDLQLRVWIDDARRRMDTISYITDHVKATFDKEKIEIPYPRRDIHIKRESSGDKSS